MPIDPAHPLQRPGRFTAPHAQPRSGGAGSGQVPACNWAAKSRHPQSSLQTQPRSVATFCSDNGIVRVEKICFRPPSESVTERFYVPRAPVLGPRLSPTSSSAARPGHASGAWSLEEAPAEHPGRAGGWSPAGPCGGRLLFQGEIGHASTPGLRTRL